MKTEKLAHWAEIISSLVVVVTLIFLINEVQRNTRALERQAIQDRAADLHAPFFEAPELASIMVKIKGVDGTSPLQQALADRYNLSSFEAVLWERHLSQLWMGLETDFYLGVDPQAARLLVRSLLRNPDNQLWWEIIGPFTGGDFGAFVDSLAAEIQAGP